MTKRIRHKSTAPSSPRGQPVFEILQGKPGAVKRTIRIYADGRVEGLGDDIAIVNRLTATIDRIVRAIGDRCGLIAAAARRELGL